MKKNIFITVLLLLSYFLCYSQVDTIFVYGPGGPYPAINEVASIYSIQHNIPIKVIKGPVDKWKDSAIKNADIIYSGSEFMMTNFIKLLPNIEPATVTPLYLRPSGIIVRPGNPKDINTFADILDPEVKIMVVNGAGLTGIWEDIAGKTKSIDTLKLLRKNIVFYADNSGVAKKEWTDNPEIDVWITWNIWQIANKDIAEFILLDERYTIYRDCGIAITKGSVDNKYVRGFFEFLKSEMVKPIFSKWGWIID